jgi:hypothetical protein
MRQMKNSKWDIEKNTFNFAQDLKYGQLGEKRIRKMLENLVEGSFEVKSDRYRNGNMAVEMRQNPRREGRWIPSGLQVTKATWWVYIFSMDGGFVIVSVDRLKRYIETNKDTLETRDFARRSTNPAWGYLLRPENVSELLHSDAYDG